MSSFENKIIDIPHHSPWHLVTGSIVLTFGTFISVVALGWLLQ